MGVVGVKDQELLEVKPAERTGSANADVRPWTPDRSGRSGALGSAMTRLEDPALLTGAGRYCDDAPVAVGTLYAAILRSPKAHAKILSIDVSAAKALPGVHAVITGEDIRAISDPFLVALKAPIYQWSLAVDAVRFVGEAVAVVVADDRYIAEDGVELVNVTYEDLPVVVDCLKAVQPDAPVLHAPAGTNEISNRRFVYGEPDKAFAEAADVVKRRSLSTRALPTRRWSASSSLLSTIRLRNPTTYIPISRDRSARIR